VALDLAVAEVDYLGLAVVEQDVGRLEVAVEDALADQAAAPL